MVNILYLRKRVTKLTTPIMTGRTPHMSRWLTRKCPTEIDIIKLKEKNAFSQNFSPNRCCKLKHKLLIKLIIEFLFQKFNTK